MRAAVLHGPGDLRIETVVDPVPGPGELVVEVEVALTCATDAKMMRIGAHPALGPLPAPLGHECAGRVVARGSGVSGPPLGTRVVPGNSAPCDTCRACRRGRPSLCADPLYLNGAYARYLRVPARIARRNLLRPPPRLDPALAALAEPLACAVSAAERCGADAADAVVVLGAGAQGLFFTWLLAQRGCRVIVCDPHRDRRERASLFGAAAVAPPPAGSEGRDAVLAHTPEGAGADVVVVAAGRTAAWEQALAIVRPGGDVHLHAGLPPGGQIPVDPHLLHYREVTLRGSYHHTPGALRAALAHLAAAELPAARLLGPPVGLDDLEATLTAGGDKRPVRVLS